jgi:DNA-binding SARP family transcriptional activator
LIRVGGQELAEGPPLKSQALLYYLAVTGRPRLPGFALSTLLWGEMADATARTNLRLALSRLRKAPSATGCMVDRHTVALDPTRAPWVDANHLCPSDASPGRSGPMR